MLSLFSLAWLNAALGVFNIGFFAVCAALGSTSILVLSIQLAAIVLQIPLIAEIIKRRG